MQTGSKPGPQQEIAITKVLVPTIVTREMYVAGVETKKLVSIQWFGESDNPHVPKDSQFFFPTGISPKSPVWMNDLNSFQVIFIGKIRDWLDPDAVSRMVELTKRSIDTSIVWLKSPRCPAPGEASSPMLILADIGDPVCGLIEPRLYSDMLTHERIMETVEQNMALAQKLLSNPAMKLPEEEFPWVDTRGKCYYCESFKNSKQSDPAIPPSGNPFDLTYVCPICGRRWWQYNESWHHWKHVSEPSQWDFIRRQQIFKNAGYEPFERL